MESKSSQEKAAHWCDADERGQPVIQERNGTKFANLCPGTAFARETVVNVSQQALRELGVKWLHLDQIVGGASGYSWFCFSSEHGHPPGMGMWRTRAMVNLLSQVRKRGKAADAGTDPAGTALRSRSRLTGRAGRTMATERSHWHSTLGLGHPAEQIEQDDFVIVPGGPMWRVPAMNTQRKQGSHRHAARVDFYSVPASASILDAAGLKSKFLSLRAPRHGWRLCASTALSSWKTYADRRRGSFVANSTARQPSS